LGLAAAAADAETGGVVDEVVDVNGISISLLQKN
jgi:hypothetical protein